MYNGANLRDKVAVVTGSGRGIGRAIALALAKDGADIVVSDSDEEGMNLVKQEVENIGRRSMPCKVDVSIKKEVDNLMDMTVKEFGKIDILVNNAGVAILNLIENFTEEDWNKVLSVNLTGVFFCSQAAGKEMIKNKKGKIINISSIRGKVAAPMCVAYSTSKAGVIALTKALAVEWAKYNIDVNAVAPGYIKTSLIQREIDRGVISEGDMVRRTPKGRLGTPEEIAEVVKFLASDKSNYITGTTIYVDGGLLA